MLESYSHSVCRQDIVLQRYNYLGCRGRIVLLKINDEVILISKKVKRKSKVSVIPGVVHRFL